MVAEQETSTERMPAKSGLLDRAILFALAATLSISIKKHLIFRENHFGGSIGLRFSITDALVIVLLVAASFRSYPRLDRLITINGNIAKAFFLYGVIAFFSAILGADVELGIFEIVALSQAFVLFVFLTNYLSSQRRIRVFVAGSLVGMLIQCAATFIEVEKPGYLTLASLGAVTEEEHLVVKGRTGLPGTDHGTTFIGGEVQQRPSGLLIHPNALALYLAMMIPLAAGVWLSYSDLSFRLLSGFALAAGLGAIYFTLSRSGWVALAIGLACAFVLSRTWRILRIGFREKLAIFVAAIALVGVAVWHRDKIVSRLTETASEAVDFRSQLSWTAFRMLAEHPFLGVGLNSFDVVAPEYDLSTTSRIKVFPVHNCLLLELSEVGLLGGASFVLLLAVAFGVVYRNAKSAITSRAKMISLFSLCGVAAFFVGDLSNPLYRTPILTSLIWAQFALALAAANAWRQEAKCQPALMEINQLN
jgi:putative inorganic carbon (hco3(-)) transporter